MSIETSRLIQKKCVPCQGGVPPLGHEELKNLLEELNGSWRIERGHHLEKEYAFANFRQALSFTNHIGELAEKEQHHPDIYLSYGKVKLLIWTHKIDGLTENDFILAAKCDLENVRFIADRACF